MTDTSSDYSYSGCWADVYNDDHEEIASVRGQALTRGRS